ncbi:MAG: hypothetical protein ACRDL1_00195 [Solirubrobacterales bacterium]
MPRIRNRRTWLSAEVPTDLAQAFKAAAAADDRTGTQQLRYLVRRYVAEHGDGAPAGAAVKRGVEVPDGAER